MFFAVTWALTPDWRHAGCVGLAVVLVIVVERRIARREGQTAVGHAEDERETLARLLALELAHDRSQSVLESLHEGVLVVDEGGEIVYSNPAAWRALSRPDLDPAGMILWEELSPRLAHCAREAWSELRNRTGDAGGGAAPIRYPSIPAGAAFFDLTAVLVTSSRTGQNFGTVFLLVDTTRNHQLQRLKDRFLSSMSHELRTPLTNICAYAELLDSMTPGDSVEWPEFVRVIHHEGQNLSRLVDEMFDFLQLESGDAAFHVESVAVGEAVRSVVAEFGLAARSRGIALELTAATVDAVLEIDRRRFLQLCRQLLDNAIKFAPDGGRVDVTCSQSGRNLELRVEDSGPGVPQADRTRVFDKFTQLRDYLTDKPDGAGLGLATCRAIVSRCGGQVWCEESPLGGASFVVRLPLSPHAMRAGEPAPAAN